MSELDNKLDELEGDPAALEAALSDELDAIDNKQNADDNADDEKGANADDDANSKNKDKITDDKKSEDKTPEDKNKKPADDNDGKSDTKKRIEKLVARRKSAEFLANVAAETAKRAEEKKQADNKTTPDDTDTDTDDDEEDKSKLDETKVDEIIDKKLSQRDNKQKIEELDRQEVEGLVKEFPDLAKYQNEIISLAKKYPEMEMINICKLVVPAEEISDIFSDEAIKNKQDTNHYSSGGRQKRSLKFDKKPSDMTDEELKEELNLGISEGRIQL